MQLNQWNQVGASYDNNTGVAQLWHDGKMVKSRNIGQIDLATQYPIRVGSRDGDDRYFQGKIACIQVYDKALTEQQIGDLRRCPKKGTNIVFALGAKNHIMIINFYCKFGTGRIGGTG